MWVGRGWGRIVICEGFPDFLPFSVLLITIYILHHLTCKRVLSNFKTIHRNFPHHILYHLTYQHVLSNFKNSHRNFQHHILYHLTYKYINMRCQISKPFARIFNISQSSVWYVLRLSEPRTSRPRTCYKQQWRQFEDQILYNLCDQSAVHAPTLLHQAD